MDQCIQADQLIVKQFDVMPYQDVWLAMKNYALCKQPQTDELWVLQHHPVYTRGLRCKEDPHIDAQHIPVVSVDRGGLMTYHGPGQIILYALIDLNRKGLNIKQLVELYEQTVINFLNGFALKAHRIQGAPGVYLEDKKIASIGIRVKNKKTYHGLSVNFDMDLTPFSWINTCGFEKLQVVQLKDFTDNFRWSHASVSLVNEFIRLFDYKNIRQIVPGTL